MDSLNQNNINTENNNFGTNQYNNHLTYNGFNGSSNSDQKEMPQFYKDGDDKWENKILNKDDNIESNENLYFGFKDLKKTLSFLSFSDDKVRGGFFGKSGGVSSEVKYGGRYDKSGKLISGGLNTARNSGDDHCNIQTNENIVITQFPNPQNIILCPVRSGYSDNITIINSAKDVPKNLQDVISADAVITNQNNILFTIQTADAVPVLLCGVDKNGDEVVVAASCPYHSLKINILQKIAQTMIKIGCAVENIKAHIGPGRRKESYEVDVKFKQDWLKVHSDHEKFFGELYSASKDLNSEQLECKCKFDMPSLQKFQLESIGVLKKNITDCGIDVGSEDQKDNYHSYRTMIAEGVIKPNEKFGLNTSAIMIAGNDVNITQ